MVSAEDVAKAEGELKVAEAQIKEAAGKPRHRQGRARPGQAARSWSTRSSLPSTGSIMESEEKPRRKRPGQRRGRRDRRHEPAWPPMPTFRWSMPIGSRRARSSRSSPGSRTGRGEPLPIEKKRFRGKIAFIDPQIQPVAETAVRIRAEFENPGDLRPGLMVQMTIFLTPDVANNGAAGRPADPDRTRPVITNRSRHTSVCRPQRTPSFVLVA